VIRDARLEEMDTVRELFKEYENFLDFDLCFQDFQQELDQLPGYYSPPQGCLLVVEHQDDLVGCIALRPLNSEVCEMKRLYVRPQGRSRGVGRALCVELIGRARKAGYRSMKLDTVSKLTRAIVLYQDLGFQPCEPYCHNPQPDVLFLELSL
jgi:GNAT superfamily N-acetyltransferase